MIKKISQKQNMEWCCFRNVTPSSSLRNFSIYIHTWLLHYQRVWFPVSVSLLLATRETILKNNTPLALISLTLDINHIQFPRGIHIILIYLTFQLRRTFWFKFDMIINIINWVSVKKWSLRSTDNTLIICEIWIYSVK